MIKIQNTAHSSVEEVPVFSSVNHNASIPNNIHIAGGETSLYIGGVALLSWLFSITKKIEITPRDEENCLTIFWRIKLPSDQPISRDNQCNSDDDN